MKNWIYPPCIIILLTIALGCGSKKEVPVKKELNPNLEEIEPNDSQSQSQAIADGTFLRGFIGAQKDQDWYKIPIPPDSSAILRAELTGVTGINLKMELFDSDGAELLDINKNKEDEGEIITNQGLSSGVYFLRIRELWLQGRERKFNDTTAYYLHVYLSAAASDVEFESNDKAIKSSLIQSELPVRGYISPYKDVDWFKILLPKSGNHYLELQLSGLENVDLEMAVYDPIEALLLKRNNASRGEGETILNLGINPDLDFYYISVQGGTWQSNEDTTYQLTATFRTYKGKMEIEPNDRMVHASQIASGDTVRGFFDTSDDIDWYQLQCFAPHQQIARIEAFGIPKINLKLTVFNQNEEQVWSVDETGEMENEIITNLGLKSNTNYFLKVENIGRSINLDEQYAIFLNVNQFSAFEEFEPNNQKDEATPINLDTSVRGYIHSVGDEDFYKLDLSNRRITGVKLTLKGMVKVNTDIALYDADLKKIAEANSRQSEETEIISAKVTPAIYYIKVYDNDGKESNYRDQYELIVLSEQ